MIRNSIIIGYGGHSYVVLDVLGSNGISCYGYCEIEKKKSDPFLLYFLGNEKEPETLDKLRLVPVYIGIGENSVRSKIYHYLKKNGISMPSSMHRSVIVSSNVKIGDATVIMPGAIVNAMSNIGNGVICNTSSVIEHECVIGDFSHIAPGAVLAGSVIVGTHSFVGANAVVKEGVRIGNNVIVGAGSVVLSDISDNTMVYGNPAKLK